MGRGIGIDVGAEAVKVVQVRTTGAGVKVTGAGVKVTGAGVKVTGAASFSRQSLGVQDADANAVARAAAAHVAELGFRGGPAVAGITGKDVILRYLSVPPAPLWKLRQLLDYEVGEITGDDPGKFAYDFRPLSLPKRSVDELLLLVAVSRNSVLEERIAAFRAGKVRLESVCPEALGLFNVFARSVTAEPDEFVVLLDVGAEKTELVFVRNGAFVFARNVMPGGGEFTEAIAETLDVSHERAEEIKHRRGAVLSPAEIETHRGHEAEFFEVLASVAGQLVRSVQSTLMFARTQTKLLALEPSRYYLCGGGSRLKGLREYLAEGLGKPVEWLDAETAAKGSAAVAEKPSVYGVALGLAMVAASPEAFGLRLAPERVRQRRRFRRKGLFGYAAALLALLVVGVSLLGTWRGWRTARDEAVAAEAAIAEAETQDKLFEAQRTTLEDRRRKLHLLGDKVRANALLLRALGVLKRQTPEAVHLDSVWFGPERSRAQSAALGAPTGESPARFTFVVKGVARKLRALDASQELDAFVALLNGPPIAARPLRQTRRAAASGDEISFEIVFSPSEALIRNLGDGSGQGG